MPLATLPLSRGPLVDFLRTVERPLPLGSAVAIGAILAALVWTVLAGPDLPRWVGLAHALATVAIVAAAAAAGPRLLLRSMASGFVALGAFLGIGLVGMFTLWLVNAPRGSEWALALAAILGAEAAGQYAYPWTNRLVPLLVGMCLVVAAAWIALVDVPPRIRLWPPG